jgi:hypothetical protein
MSTLSGKHQFGELDEKRVTFVEKGISKERADFLQSLLKHNGFEVLIAEDKKKTEDDPTFYTVGVTDMVFNPTDLDFSTSLVYFGRSKSHSGFLGSKNDRNHTSILRKQTLNVFFK